MSSQTREHIRKQQKVFQATPQSTPDSFFPSVPAADSSIPPLLEPYVGHDFRNIRVQNDESSIPSSSPEEFSSPGQPLDSATLRFLEPGFGHDFSRIPIHSQQTSLPQTKRKVNQPGDVYEQEAEQGAEQVMRMPDRGPSVSDDEDEAKTSLMRKQSNEPQADTGTAISSVPPLVQTVLTSGVGQPLDATTRAFMEPRFGHDFSQVRVHTDERAVEAAKAVGARAFTAGNHIVGSPRALSAGTSASVRTLAHELVHTIQQRDLSQDSGVEIGRPDTIHELEAGRAAKALSEGNAIGPLQDAGLSGTLQRQKADEVDVDIEEVPADPNTNLPQAKATDPSKRSDFIDQRLTAVGVGLNGSFIILFCSGIDNPIALASDYLVFGSENSVPIDHVIYPSREEALEHVPFGPFAPGEPSKFAYYRATGGLVVPTTFSLASAPETMKLIKLAIDKFSDLFREAADTLVLSVILLIAGALLKIIGSKWIISRGGVQKLLGPAEEALAADEITAIRAYSAESSAEVNAALRGVGKISAQTQTSIANIKSGLNKLPSFSGKLFRSESLPIREAEEFYKEGKTVVCQGFTSTSKVAPPAQREGNIALTIQATGKAGKDISAVTEHAEQEVLFLPDTRFVVEKAERFRDALVVTLREL
jgi:hypothetical protein